MAALAKSQSEVLGVKRNATGDEIKKEYKNLALQVHTDKNLGRSKEATMAFQALQRAHETLTSPLKRAKYELSSSNEEEDEEDLVEEEEDYLVEEEEDDLVEEEEDDQVEEEEDDPPEVIVAIKDLKNNQVTIRARVTKKFDIRPWDTKKGKGKFFNMHLLDGSGEIRMTGFDTAVDSFYNMIQVDHVYDISWFDVNLVNKQYTSIKHDYEIIFSKNTRVICVEDSEGLNLTKQSLSSVRGSSSTLASSGTK